MQADQIEQIFNDAKLSAETSEDAEDIVDFAGYQVTKAELFHI